MKYGVILKGGIFWRPERSNVLKFLATTLLLTPEYAVLHMKCVTMTGNVLTDMYTERNQLVFIGDCSCLLYNTRSLKKAITNKKQVFAEYLPEKSGSFNAQLFCSFL